ncbi:MAG: response regulator transcription factor [Spirochaetia bacterium]
MKGSICIIEDEKELAELIAMYLDSEGLSNVICPDAETALSSVQKNDFDLLVLDINLPGMDGFEFLQELRRTSWVPVMIVSARESDADQVLGLGLGADEFVTKPFSPKVLTAKIKAMLRRKQKDSLRKTGLYCFSPYILDKDAGILKRNGRRMHLSVKEFDILAFLVENPGKAFSSDQLFSELWENEYGDLTAVGVYIQRVRKKIEPDPGNPEFIQTVHGRGYLFNPEKLDHKEGV